MDDGAAAANERGPTASEEEFDAVFRSLYPQARNVALRILGSLPAAEDAAAEAFARAYARWPSVGGLHHREAWILRVTANAALDVVRRRPPPTMPVDHPSPTDDATLLRLTLVPALQALPRRQREAVVLRHLAGLPEREVAEALRISPSSAKKHLQRGMARLRATVPALVAGTDDDGSLHRA